MTTKSVTNETKMTSKSQSKQRRSLSMEQLTESKSQSILREREATIVALRKEITSLQNKMVTQNHQIKVYKKKYHHLTLTNNNNNNNSNNQHSPSSSKTNNNNNNNNNTFHSNSTPKRHHHLTPFGNVVHQQPPPPSSSSSSSSTSSSYMSSSTFSNLVSERTHMGRNASIATAQELHSLENTNIQKQETANAALVQNILQMFNDPTSHLEYLSSIEFAKDLLRLNSKVRTIFENEPRTVFLQSPAYVFGDIHGNLEDLHFFSDNIWRLGLDLTAGNFVFLGDYVDRGLQCLEVVAYLFALKLLLPHKVFLLRGNHETRDVNGWEEHYAERSFIYQCRCRFGDDLGFKVWEQINQVFDRMPLAAVIDQDIFCVHGGIPRPISSVPKNSRVQDILNVPRVAGINPPYEHESDNYQQVASDCIWSDPASEHQEQHSVDPHTGYGESLRGGGAICFGHKAVKDFLSQHNFSYIMRAHEAHADGVAVSKGGKVFTIFSTSKDHNQGKEALAGCILVDFEKMQVINRSPAYRNQYVHRRDSVSVSKLSETEMEQRVHLGLVTEEMSEDEEEEDNEEEHDEEWEDIVDDHDDDEEENENGTQGNEVDTEEDDSDDENFTFSHRKSSVDPIQTISSPPGSSHDKQFWQQQQQQQQLHYSDDDEDEDGGVIGDVNMKVSTRKRLMRFSSIAEEDEDGDDDAMDC